MLAMVLLIALSSISKRPSKLAREPSTLINVDVDQRRVERLGERGAGAVGRYLEPPDVRRLRLAWHLEREELARLAVGHHAGRVPLELARFVVAAEVCADRRTGRTVFPFGAHALGAPFPHARDIGD